MRRNTMLLLSAGSVRRGNSSLLVSCFISEVQTRFVKICSQMIRKTIVLLFFSHFLPELRLSYRRRHVLRLVNKYHANVYFGLRSEEGESLFSTE